MIKERNQENFNLCLHWAIRDKVIVECISKVNSILTRDRVNSLTIQRSVALKIDKMR